ncbi:unnamed protein product [Ilex paraguariensis]|uniref:RING-type domain-containing protein n=1 Tax=Ilex paraguariensis TaxID=185542 RepID=A0ABC8RP94_9AQUA
MLDEDTIVKWRQNLEEKEQALALLSEEKRLKAVAEANLKRNLEFLNQKLEMDSNRLKDDIQRLENELSRLRICNHSSSSSSQGMLDSGDNWNSTVIPPGSSSSHDFSEEPICDRLCVICWKNEASILFLPCAHQVMCVSCNEDHSKTVPVGGRCPCCYGQIEQKIRVYAASS